jgi:CRISPR-associated protein Csm4
MRTVRARLIPHSAFGTLPLGDTLFGQLCWALRNRQGDKRLTALLEGYTQNRPFLVVSDAFPDGYLPRPALPSHWFTPLDGLDRKVVKKRQWMPLEKRNEPLLDWLRYCCTSADLPGGWFEAHPQPHNSIDRRTGTTGENFAPYIMPQHWHGKMISKNGKNEKQQYVMGELDLYAVLDDTRLSIEELKAALSDMGELGFGRDASIGLGRFTVQAVEAASLPGHPGANAWLTLAPCAPQGAAWHTERCFYQVFTRFGRHGDRAVHLGNPFKTPILLAASGAVLTPAYYEPRLFVGQGIGGNGSLSKAVPQTVHQGYAPVIGLKIEFAGVTA